MDTLCWSCKNACGRCAWSRKDHQPVEGWVADKTRIRNITDEGNRYYIDSYFVKQCPLYVQDWVYIKVRDLARLGNRNINYFSITNINKIKAYFESLGYVIGFDVAKKRRRYFIKRI